MSFQDARQAIETWIADRWEKAVPNGVPLVYRNMEAGPFGPEQSYAKLYILDADAQLIAFDGEGGLERAAGVIVVQCFVPLGNGEGGACEIADAVASILRRQALGKGVLTRTPRRESGRAAGSHYQVNVSVPFQKDTLYN